MKKKSVNWISQVPFDESGFSNDFMDFDDDEDDLVNDFLYGGATNRLLDYLQWVIK